MSPIDFFKSSPPISRALGLTTFIVSVVTYSGILTYFTYHDLKFDLSSIFQLPPQIWRVFTGFLITGPSLGIIFDTYFLFTYGVKLEFESPRFAQRADFFVYGVFICTVILLLNTLVTPGHAFASALALAFITTSTKQDWDIPIVFFIVKMPAQYLPYVFLLVTFILAGPEGALIEASGLAGAHLYDVLSGIHSSWGPNRNLLETPAFVQKWFGSRLVVERTYGTGVHLAQRGSEPAWGLSWGRFGKGQRLGGEGGSTSTNQRPKGAALAVIVMVVFVVICCLLGVSFLRYRDPEGWVDTLKAAFGFRTVSSGKVY